MGNEFAIRTFAKLAIQNGRHAREVRRMFGEYGKKEVQRHYHRAETFLDAARILAGSVPLRLKLLRRRAA